MSKAIELVGDEWQPAPLPVVAQAKVLAPRGRELPVRAAAVAAAGGAVAGLASVVIARVAANQVRQGLRPKRSRKNQIQNVLASRSFLVDVHLLGKD